MRLKVEKGDIYMLNEAPKKLILIANKNTDVYCEYMSMLISTVDDIKNSETGETEKAIGITDGSIDTAIWTNEIYRDNRSHTSSRQKMLFIGNDGCTENIIPNITFHDKDETDMGIYCGWLGNKACIYVDDTLVKNEKIYMTDFRKKYKELFDRYNNRLKNVVEKKYDLKKSILLGAAGILLFPGFLPFAFTEYKDTTQNKHEILDQAYRYAVLKFYLDYLENFMR